MKALAFPAIHYRIQDQKIDQPGGVSVTKQTFTFDTFIDTHASNPLEGQSSTGNVQANELMDIMHDNLHRKH